MKLERVDVTKENGLFRSMARSECMIGKLLIVMVELKDKEILKASEIGINKNAFALRVSNNEIGIILNPEVICKSGVGRHGRCKKIGLDFTDTSGRRQKVKFRNKQAHLISEVMNI